MKLHRWNGEHWWVDDRGAVARVARWILWPGGWETFRKSPLTDRLNPRLWTPFALFGRRITCYGWGWQVRVRGGYWVLSGRGRRTSIYWSPDGTPSGATVWLRGAPVEVTGAASWDALQKAARR